MSAYKPVTKTLGQRKSRKKHRPKVYSSVWGECSCELFILVINFELVQPIRSRYINVRDTQTDGRTDGRTTYDSNIALALRASRHIADSCCIDCGLEPPLNY